MTDEIGSLIVISDLHCGCQLGLCSSSPQKLDGGGFYTPSDLQKKVWKLWGEFWNTWVPDVTRKRPYAVLVNGDAVDGSHHRSTTQISQNPTDQKKIAMEILEPIVEKCKGNFYMTRGTEVHVGSSGCEEESLAKSLGAIPDGIGNYSRYELVANLNGNLIHALHHIGTTGSTAYEATAPMRELDTAFSEAGRWDNRKYDVLLRAHRHRAIIVEVPTATGYGICAISPGWQLMTPFAYRIPGARQSTPQFGGLVVKSGDEDPIYVRSRIWNITRTPETKL